MSDWKSNLVNFISKKEDEKTVEEEKLKIYKAEVSKFYSEVVLPAFEELKGEIEKHQREVKIFRGIDSASINVDYKGETEMDYSITVRIFPTHAVPYYKYRVRDSSDGTDHNSEGDFQSVAQKSEISQITKAEIRIHWLDKYITELQHK
jgi:hypothetical protein